MKKFKQAFKRLDQCIEKTMEVVNLPGMAVGLTDREELLRVSTYGFADVAAQLPLTSAMLFEIGSICKSFTTIALLQLREEGLLDLHEPVTRYLPWFKVQSEYEPITPHHMMSHTAGITMGAEFPGEARYEVWALRETETTAPPGTYYHYSDAGYKTLGVILEELLRDVEQARPTPILSDVAAGPKAIEDDSHAGISLLPDGYPLSERAGRLHRSGTRLEFYFTSGSPAPDAPDVMEFNKNRWLEAMEAEAEAGVEEFIISAEVTRYRGQNYLNLWKYRRQISHGNLSP